MNKVLIFGGTSEGRLLSQRLSDNKIPCDVCVATEYGREVLNSDDYVKVISGRLSQEEMQKLFQATPCSVVIDATHPYASQVSENIKKSLAAHNAGSQGVKIKLLRFERDTKSKTGSENLIFFENAEECAAQLSLEIKNTDKNVLLTTGSKDLAVFCKDQTLRSRIIARVIPSIESLEICQKNGLEGRQIIAMQGPFSRQMNLAQILDNRAGILVTKESGAAGGFDEKIEAAMEAGVKCFVIKKPEESGAENAPVTSSDYEIFTSLEGLFSRLCELLHIAPEMKKHKVILAGIGMGSTAGMTAEVQKAIKNASCLFGAERILASAKKLNENAASYAFWLAKDIIPVLQKISAGGGAAGGGTGAGQGASSSVILFSGDTGFYSGAEKLLSELRKLPDISLEVLPGISSMQYLFAKAGLSWQNTTVLNLHGVQKDEWADKLSKIVYKNKQIFFISSSFSDIQELGSELSRISGFSETQIKVILGYQLSYPEEKIRTLSPKELQTVFRPGLYSGIIVVGE